MVYSLPTQGEPRLFAAGKLPEDRRALRRVHRGPQCSHTHPLLPAYDLSSLDGSPLPALHPWAAADTKSLCAEWAGMEARRPWPK